MAFETIRYAEEGGLGVITLNRPDKLNAVNAAMIGELHAALDRAEASEAVRAILLHGEGRAFSAGFDLAGGDWSSEESARAELQHDFDIILRFWHSPKVTVAALHGYCLGSACEIAIACDLAVAAEGTRLGWPEVKFGSGIVALILPWITGAKAAKELLLTGDDRLSAQRAYELGLVNRVVPEGDHLEAARLMALTVAANDPTAVKLTKLAINRAYDAMGFTEGLKEALELDVQAETIETEESREFDALAAEQGHKAAIAWRRKKYGLE